jgi:hypothetical protein
MDNELWIDFQEKLKAPKRKNMGIDWDEDFVNYAEQFKKDFKNGENLITSEDYDFVEGKTEFVDVGGNVFGYFLNGFHRYSQHHVDEAEVNEIYSFENYTVFKNFKRDGYRNHSFGFANSPEDARFFEKYMTKLEDFPLKLRTFSRQGMFKFGDNLRGRILMENEMRNNKLKKYTQVTIVGGKYRENFAQALFYLEEDLPSILNIENSFFDIKELEDILQVVENAKLDGKSRFYHDYRLNKNGNIDTREESLKGTTFREALERMK